MDTVFIYIAGYYVVVKSNEPVLHVWKWRIHKNITLREKIKSQNDVYYVILLKNLNS